MRERPPDPRWALLADGLENRAKSIYMRVANDVSLYMSEGAGYTAGGTLCRFLGRYEPS